MGKKLRSHDWFLRSGKMGFMYRTWLRNQGIPDHEFDGRPVIGICNTWSELTPCNAHFREFAEYIKRGVYEAGGFPLEFPIMSMGEPLMKPTAMLFRNLASMDAEETIRANPLDGIVIIGGCDKTTPSALMGAASVDLPTIVVSGGAMLNGKFRGKDIGSGTDIWKFSEEVRAGRMSEDDFREAEGCMSRSCGHCMTMGTASSMAILVEALGMSLSGNAAIPAPDSRRKVLCHESGIRIVEMVKEDQKISDIITKESMINAIVVNAAVGGSTNIILHLLAIAGRVGIDLKLDDFDKYGSHIPLLVNMMPSGKFLMEEFYYAGGLPVVLNELKDHINLDLITATGKTHRENISGAECYNQEVIAPMDNPLINNAGIVVLKGNLAENGAVIKPSAVIDQRLLQHTGPAVVFENIEDLHNRIDDLDLEIDENSIIVLKNVGPKGFPGMPEVGNTPLPKKLLEKGITDMIRISDGRMSGTAYGSVILHVSPEAAVGGTFGIVKEGDMIEVDVKNRKLELLVSEEELKERKANWKLKEKVYTRGYVSIYQEHVNQAHLGADFDKLVGNSGKEVSRDGF
ncbi:dihydroxy-acid dehydratase [Flavobacteriaceae bacterium F89]|uniref:Dihydroxy-acid dehydratase n=1 Tax=Cerina litoralis TaxID=2874477 RepID=A0AAE3EXY4_9FLAO|nr:IlvD/Edd family dehydratase [Cerina litoralis]MCG2461631.1 dihydroxy-acid dehydratase [Cerina litoralis]